MLAASLWSLFNLDFSLRTKCFYLDFIWHLYMNKAVQRGNWRDCVESRRLIKSNNDAGDCEDMVADANSVLICLQVKSLHNSCH